MLGSREWKVIRKERRQGQGGEKRGGGAETKKRRFINLIFSCMTLGVSICYKLVKLMKIIRITGLSDTTSV